MREGFGEARLVGSETEAITGIVSQDPANPWNALLTGRGRYLDDAKLILLWAEIVTAQARNAAEIATLLSDRYGTLAALLCVPERELATIAGIGQHLIPSLKVLHEAALRYNRARLDGEDVLSDEKKLLDYLTARLARETVEQFRIVFLTDTGRLISDEAQARGTVNHTPVYPREVARRAMELQAASIVLVHNHPSGDPTPSDADMQMTRQVQAATRAIGIEVLDHYIIGNGRHVSFRALEIL